AAPPPTSPPSATSFPPLFATSMRWPPTSTNSMRGMPPTINSLRLLPNPPRKQFSQHMFSYQPVYSSRT
ncbi:hypothetical protein L195_g061936, partial [Trifolium pratense]